MFFMDDGYSGTSFEMTHFDFEMGPEKIENSEICGFTLLTLHACHSPDAGERREKDEAFY